METNETDKLPTPEEARIALAAARSEEDNTVHRPVPVWYYPMLAAIIFTMFALNSIEGATTFIRVLIGVLAIVLAAAVGGVVGRISFSRPGYKKIHVSWGPTILTVLIALVFPVAAILLAGVLGSWVWIVAGAGIAALILIVGVPYQRKHRRG